MRAGVDQLAPLKSRLLVSRLLRIDLATWQEIVAGIDWKGTLAHAEDRDTIAALRLNTYTGLPLASDSFLSKLERKLGRRFRPLPVGRPRKLKSKVSGKIK